jgi:cellulose 1,4-beta-cellobiosidase
VWFGNQCWNTISYVRTSGTTSVSNMDIDSLTADAISRGYIQKSWFLIDVEAGFELWQGGAGLGTNSFSVNTNGSGGPPPTTNPPTTNPPTTNPPTTNPPPTTQPGGGSPTCRAVYTVGNAWAGGFQAQIVLSNTGTTATHGWALDWTFPGDQKISNLWGGTVTQSGANVHVTNASYDGGVAPGSSVTFGFTATSSSSNNTPSAITCTAS